MLVIQFPMSDDEELDDLEFRGELEEIAAIALNGIGTCDGGDIGSGTINVFCTVGDADAQKGCKAIVAGLEAKGIEGAVIAYFDDEDEDAEPNVLHPEGYTGTFSVL